MADQVINYGNPASGTALPQGFVLMKQISWPAIFSGVLVALGVEVLFLSFGLFVGFRMSPGAATTWGAIWYWIGCFFSLMAGGWVAARLGGNPTHGKVHGIVTWGLATVATFAFMASLSWGVVSQSVGIARTAALATASAAPLAERVAPNQADRMVNDANTAVNQAQQNAPVVLERAAHDISTVSLVLWIGFLIAACGSVLGGAMAVRRITTPRAAA
jgi:hypothetical protein